MFIEKAIIHYDNILEASIGDESLELTQYHPEEPDKRQTIYLRAEELSDLNALAKLLGWEI